MMFDYKAANFVFILSGRLLLLILYWLYYAPPQGWNGIYSLSMSKISLIDVTLKSFQVFVGLGFPYEGPAPLEAIANGAVFLNPVFDVPKDSLNTPFFKVIRSVVLNQA